MTRRPWSKALAFVLLVAPPVSETGAVDGIGSIVGSVDVRLPLSPPRARPSVRGLGTPVPHGVPDRSLSVVYLETAPQGAFEDVARPRAILDQRRETFVPYVLPIVVGTTVEFPNSDPFFHNVFSLSEPRRFDLGRYPQGKSKSVVFNRPGVVRVFCDIHSHMSAFILVFSHRYFTTTDASGRFVLEGVPAGRYDIAVWTDGKVRTTHPVRVTAGEAVEVDFVVE